MCKIALKMQKLQIATVIRDVNLEGISFKYPSVAWLVSIEMNNFVADMVQLTTSTITIIYKVTGIRDVTAESVSETLF